MKQWRNLLCMTLAVVILAGAVMPKANAQTAVWPASQMIDLGSSATQLNPAVAVDSAGNVYAAWEDYRNGNADIYFSQLNAGTTIWSNPVRLNGDDGSAAQLRPSIAVGGSYVYVAWEDARWGEDDWDIYSTRRLISGGAWELDQLVNGDRADYQIPDQGNQKRVSLCVERGGVAYAVWQDQRNGAKKAYYSERASSALEWALNDKVTSGEGTYSNDPNEQTSPNIGCINLGSTLLRYVVWEDHRSDNANIFNSQRNMDGSWAVALGEKISDDANRKEQTVPAIAFNSYGTAVAVWLDDRTDATQIWGASKPNGGSWTANYQISSAGAQNSEYVHPRVAVASDGTPYVVWIDGGGNVAYSMWNGSGWTAQAHVSDVYTGAQRWPDIAAGLNGLVHVVWADGRSGIYRIYYTTNTPVAVENMSSVRALPGAASNGEQFYLDLIVHNSEPATRLITATVQLPNDFYFYPPSGAAAVSAQSNKVQFTAHTLTYTVDLASDTYSQLPWWPIYVSTSNALPTLLYGTAVITDHVTNSSNAEVLWMSVILNPLRQYLPLSVRN
jgi:hypothetical protein